MEDNVKELLITYLNSIDNKKRERKIIFWYDENAEYIDAIDELVTDENTEIIKYNNNSFWIRYHIEKEVPEKNIVLYFSTARPEPTNNDLLDLESQYYDYIFNPDTTSILINALHLSNDNRKVIKNNLKYFKDKKRIQRFLEFDLDNKDNNNIDLIIIACLLNIKTINIDEIIKNIFISNYENNSKITELFKWANLEYLLNLINSYFGSNIETEKDLDDLFKNMIFSYYAYDLKNMKLLDGFGKFLLSKKTNVHIFVNSLMRDTKCNELFEKVSTKVLNDFNIEKILDKDTIDNFKYSDAFSMIEEKIVSHICNGLNDNTRLYDEYEELISIRESKYWHYKYLNEYNSLKNAITFLKNIDIYTSLIRTDDIDVFAKLYTDKLYYIDTLYRKFYYYIDKVNLNNSLKILKAKIENLYVNDFISKLSIRWTESINQLPRYDSTKILMQNKFYDEFVKSFEDKKNRVIVIISDAFRYELAKELSEKLIEFGGKTSIDYMQGLVPSYTKLGMASLLPNNKLEIGKGDEILVDGHSSSSISDREKILNNRIGDSLAIKYSELIDMTTGEWKKKFSGKKIIYIYHDKVDNTGEHNEEKIFDACEESIYELYKLIRDLHTTFSGVNLYVTSDHGFFYKRSKLESSDKVAKDSNATIQKTRYSFSNLRVNEEGIISLDLEYLFGKNSGFVNVPNGNAVFSRQGTGFNYIHGGILPQEILIPVVSFKSNRKTDVLDAVGITYSGISRKINDSITLLTFIQDNNVSEKYKECRYLLHFEDEEGYMISNQCVIIANYYNKAVEERQFKEKFVFKNMTYGLDKKYFLVITNEETNEIISKEPFYIDIVSR